MKKFAFVALLLAFCAPLFGQEITLTPAAGETGDFITVTAKTEGTVVKWHSPDKRLKLFPTHLLKDTKIAVVTSAEPGTYELVAWTAKGDSPSDLAICKVVVSRKNDGNTPVPPNPGPTPPEPTPDPTPVDPAVKRSIHVVIVEETKDATAARSRFFTDDALRARIAEKKHAWTIFDKDIELRTAPKSYKAYLELVQANKLTYPCIFLVDKATGKLLTKYGGPMPASPADLIKLLEQYGG